MKLEETFMKQKTTSTAAVDFRHLKVEVAD